MPLRIDLENPERESGLALDPLDEPSFLPVGMFPASEGEQDLVWGERSDVVLDRVMGVSSPTAPPTTLAPLGTSCPRIVSRRSSASWRARSVSDITTGFQWGALA